MLPRTLTHRAGRLFAVLALALLLPSLALAQPVINEVDADQAGTDMGEFVELFGDPNAVLDGYVVVFYNGSNDTSYAAYDLDGFTLDGDGFFVLGNAAVPNVSIVFASNGLQNGADAVALYTGDASDFPNGTAVTATNLVDAVVYDTNDSDDTGLLTVLTPGQAQLNEGGNGNQTGDSNSRLPDGGTPLDTSTYVHQAPTPGVSNVPGPTAVVINEVDADQVSTDMGEFVELFGAGGAPLDGLVVVFYNGSSDTSYAAFDLDGFSLSAGGYFVLGNAAVANVGLVFADNSLQNGADAVAVYEGDATDFPNGTAVTAANLVDALVYDTNDSDDAGLLAVLTPGQAQLNEGGNGDQTGESNSRVPDGGAPLDTSTYVQQAPTPGATNNGPVVAPDVVINEVDADQSGTDMGEFVELFGTGGAALDGLVVVFYNGSGDASYSAFDLDGFSLDADGFFVLGNAAVPNVDIVFGSNGLQNGADAVAIYVGNASDFPNGTAVTASNLIDAVVYGTGDADDAGLLAVLTPGQAQVDEGGNGNQTGDSNSRFPDGGTALDTSTYVQQAPTPGISNVPGPTAVVINEVDADQVSTDTGEFVELLGPPNAPLDGLVVVFFNGSSDTSYNAFDLDGLSTNGAGFFVLGNAAVANVGLVFANNSLQNGADAVAVYEGDASDFPNGTAVTAANLVDAVVYDTNDSDDTGLLAALTPGQAQVNEGANGNQTGDSNSRVPDGGTPFDTSTYVAQAPTPGASNVPPQILEIFEIQGNGLASPFATQTVTTVDNVVTALGLDGFFIQTPEARADADVETSNGIFVFTSVAPTVAVGDLVDVTGEVVEFFDLTEIRLPVVTVTSSGNPLPATVVLDGATPSPVPPQAVTELERFEGMLVEVTGGSVTGPNQSFGSDPLAEVNIVAGPNRAFREPGITFPGLPGLPVFDGNPEIFELDPDKLGLPNLAIPAGSTFDAVGVLGFEFGGYEIWPTQLTVNEAIVPRAVSPRQPGEMTIGALNMFRLFDDIDDPGSEDDGTVLATVDYDRRLGKLALYIVDVLDAPDILATSEVEKLGALEDLAAVIATNDPTVNYTSFLVEGNDVGGIDVGFMVRDSVTVDAIIQMGASETLSVDGSPLHDRPPLLLEGSYVGSGSPLPISVLAVHSRSLSGIDDTGANGNRVRQKRLEQAQSIAQMVQDLQTTDPAINLAVVGDFNAYEFTDGYVDVVGQMAGDFNPADNERSGPDLVNPNLVKETFTVPAMDRYSFIFRGSAQAIDHALTSQSLAARVTGMEFGRGNADAARILIDDGTTALRSSDHDGLVLYVMAELDSDFDGIEDGADLCPGTVIPEDVPTRRLLPWRFALVDGDGTFDTYRPGHGIGPSPWHNFTLAETGGCSCEQIIESIQVPSWFERLQRRYGCSLFLMKYWVYYVAQ
ncbi:MAG: hypothetical protein AAF604_07230 [Acidobacteriota bacterium]